MKKIHLHIGFHKTGTSALQEYLDDNREELISKNIFYPKVYEDKYPGNVDFSWAFNDNPPKWGNVTHDNKDEILNFYKQQIEKTSCENIIISSEDFVLVDNQPKSIEKIKEFFEEYCVKIIAYVREPMDFTLSLYSHAVKDRQVNCSLKTYIAEHFSFLAADYPTRLQPWVRIFEKENLIVKKYDPKAFTGGSLITDFFEAVGLSVLAEPTMKNSNVGIHPWLIQPYIEISSSDLEEDLKVKKLRELQRVSIDLPKENAVSYLMDAQDLAIIKNTYQVMKNRLRREYGVEFE